mgnify:CR=1 FL=1
MVLSPAVIVRVREVWRFDEFAAWYTAVHEHAVIGIPVVVWASWAVWVVSAAVSARVASW